MSFALPLLEWPTTFWPRDFRRSYAAAPIPRLAPVIRIFMTAD